MVGKQINLVHPGQLIRKGCNCLNLIRRIVKGGNHRNPDAKACLTGCRNLSRILQHQLIAFACKLFMFFAIDVFDIHQVMVEVGKNLLDNLPFRTAHALHCSIDT